MATLLQGIKQGIELRARQAEQGIDAIGDQGLHDRHTARHLARLTASALRCHACLFSHRADCQCHPRIS
jgi:hypothetical protein